ncbi:hypothetical protein [Streptomyces sp. Y1]|uniref:Integron gene cassette protein n=1 Tax=Streptomyces sp. Y1 TaxID=3238634 RepID=A0AB39TV51_9ACTN
MTEKTERQAVIVTRIFKGEGSEEDSAEAARNFELWVELLWQGNEAAAVAACARALEAECGRHWTRMDERDRGTHVWFFSYLCPLPETLRPEARDYRDGVLSGVGFQELAKAIRFRKGEPE